MSKVKGSSNPFYVVLGASTLKNISYGLPPNGRMLNKSDLEAFYLVVMLGKTAKQRKTT